VDIATANNAGVPCISVAWGFRSREFLQSIHAQTIIDTPHELLKYIG
jgi:phosphoglycolate phosphatase